MISYSPDDGTQYFAPFVMPSEQAFRNAAFKSLPDQVQGQFVDYAASGHGLLELLTIFETQKASTVIEHLGLLLEHTTHCSTPLPFTFGLITIGTAVTISKYAFGLGNTILVSRLLYGA
jgi:hypothetical protein